MTDKHDFKAALEDLNPAIGASGGDLFIRKDGERVYDCGHTSFETIQSALRIADRLQSGEVSDGAINAGAFVAEWTDNPPEWVAERLGLIFKAMAAQLTKEIDDEV